MFSGYNNCQHSAFGHCIISEQKTNTIKAEHKILVFPENYFFLTQFSKEKKDLITNK